MISLPALAALAKQSLSGIRNLTRLSWAQHDQDNVIGLSALAALAKQNLSEIHNLMIRTAETVPHIQELRMDYISSSWPSCMDMDNG